MRYKWKGKIENHSLTSVQRSSLPRPSYLIVTARSQLLDYIYEHAVKNQQYF